MPRVCLLALVLGAAFLGLGQVPITVTNLGFDPCSDPDQVTVQGVNEGAAAGYTQLIPVLGSTRIYLCSARIQGGAAGQMFALFGSGAACADNQDFLTVHALTAANTPPLVLEAAGGNATFKRSAPARAFCIWRSGSMTAVGHVRFVQITVA